jgi:hypothetical protein
MHYMHTQLNKDCKNRTSIGLFAVIYGSKQFLFSRDGFSI